MTFLISVLGAHNVLMRPIPTNSWAHYILYVYQEHASIHSRPNKQLLILSCVCMTCFTHTHSFQHSFKYLRLYFHDTCCSHPHPLFLQQIVIYILTLSTYDMFLYTRILTNSSLYSHAFDLCFYTPAFQHTAPYVHWLNGHVINQMACGMTSHCDQNLSGPLHCGAVWRTRTETPAWLLFLDFFIVGLFDKLGPKPQPDYPYWNLILLYIC